MSPGTVDVIVEVFMPMLLASIGVVTVEGLWQETVPLGRRWRTSLPPLRTRWRFH